jgi:hypothetical protein
MRLAPAVVLAAIAACVGNDPDTTPASSSGGSSGGASSGGGSTALDTYDFEEGCGGWLPTGTATTDTVRAQGGSTACRICLNAGDDYAFLSRTIERPLAVGDEVTMTAYVSAPTDGPSAGTMIVELITVDEGERHLEEEESHPTLTGEWQKSVTTLKVTKPGAKLVKLSVGAAPKDGASDGCFVLDDVVFAKK